MSERPEQLWLGAPVVLASRSAGRARILRNAGVPFTVHPADIDERTLEIGVAHDELALKLAQDKARHVSREHPSAIVLGADQTLTIAGALLHKPGAMGQARDQLLSMRGRSHTLTSALAVARDGEILFRHRETATIIMRRFSERTLDAYLAAMGDRALASVGCYEIEGLGTHLIARIDGDWFTIVGLPILPFLAYCRKHGLLRD